VSDSYIYIGRPDARVVRLGAWGLRLVFSRRRAHASGRATVDLEFVDGFDRLWGVVFRDGCQGLVSIDVALANELTGLWINLAKVASLRAM
jgi:hypothetical protein